MKHADVIVVGAGPAGIAAATAAARHGRSVLLLDDNPAAGGQIWRGGIEAPIQRANRGENARRNKALRTLASSGAALLSGYRVFDAPAPQTLSALRETAGDAEAVGLQYDHLILATGARERFLPFPGWTLPGVFGAGGLQALVKGGFPVQGKRVAIAGSGPLLVGRSRASPRVRSARDQCRGTGTDVAARALRCLALVASRKDAMQGIGYRAAIGNAPYRTGCWPVAALADEATGLLKSVRFTDGAKAWDEPCDMLACGFHLVPNTELASLLGCKLRGDFVAVDEQQQTSVANVYCAGEPTGIAGLEAALLQGEIAGLACARQKTEPLRARNAAEQKFAARLENRISPAARTPLLAASETIVCRCEDVTYGDLASCAGWTDAKLQTRCGMGPCQGRICGPATQTLFGWTPKSIRPPLFPVPVNALCFHDFQHDVPKENA